MDTQISHISDGVAEAPTSLDEVLDRVRSLQDLIRSRAHAVERAGRVSADTMRLLKEAGVFRLMQPKRFGGLGLGPSAAVRLGWELGRACGSTAWCTNVMVNNAWILSFWPLQAQVELWCDNPDALVCGTGAPTARAEAVEGGYLVSGCWPFASSCDNADWIYLSCRLPEPEKGIGWFLVPMATVRIDHESWDVCGLKGTGSKTVHVADAQFVPEHRVHRPGQPSREPNRDVLTGFMFPTFGPAGLVAPILGMARGALDWFAEAMLTKVRAVKPGVTASVASSHPVQAAIGAASAELEAAFLLLVGGIEHAEKRVFAGEALDQGTRIRLRRDQGHAARSAVDTVNLLFQLSGASSTDLSVPIQRHWRDVNVAAHHVSLDVTGINAMVGQAALGQEPVGMF